MQPPRGNLFLSFFCLLLFQWDEGGGGGWLVWGRTGFLNSDVDGVVAGLLVLIPLAALVLWLLERTIELTPVAPTPTPPPPPPPLLPSEPCNGALDDVNAEEELEEEALGTRIPDNRRPAITFGTNYLNADGIRGSVYPRSWNNASKHSRFFPKILQENLRSAPRTDDPTERKNRIRKKKNTTAEFYTHGNSKLKKKKKNKNPSATFSIYQEIQRIVRNPTTVPQGIPQETLATSVPKIPSEFWRILKESQRLYENSNENYTESLKVCTGISRDVMDSPSSLVWFSRIPKHRGGFFLDFLRISWFSELNWEHLNILEFLGHVSGFFCLFEILHGYLSIRCGGKTAAWV